MNIKLKKKFLYYKNYKLRCAIGKRGITSNKKEGDKKTPKGTFTFGLLFYRKDKIIDLNSSLKKQIIKKNMGWCDDSDSKFYNQLIRFPFKDSAEKLWLKKRMYDLILVINYNLKPTIKKRGSAIFLHLANKNYTPTRGCIALSKKDMLLLINNINKKTKLIIS
jgi:L,D-peptidoglycan transpeptidase YkuD (ErfK/YbiS/YcfS/YnhG family)